MDIRFERLVCFLALTEKDNELKNRLSLCCRTATNRQAFAIGENQAICKWLLQDASQTRCYVLVSRFSAINKPPQPGCYLTMHNTATLE